MAESIQTNIEIMTRRLELEKRRLARLDKELVAANRTHELKAGQHQKNRKGEANSRPSTAPRPIAGGGGVGEERPKTGRSASRASSAGERKSGKAPVDPESTPYRTLLHRLDVQIKKLDCVRNDNTRLQHDIDQVRRQRMQMNSIFERLKLEIKQRSAQLMDVNEETATGKTVQGDAEQRVAVMKRQREGERARFKDQVLKIRRDLQDYEFEKKEVEVKLKRAQEGVQKKRGLIMPPEENEFSEPAMMRRIMKTAFLNCIQRRHIRQHEKTIALFEQAFATIKQTTGISNIEEIVKIFVVLESKNYSLLTYVNHMNREIEALEAVRNRRQTAESMRSQLEEKQEQYKEKTVGTMQKQLEARSGVIASTREACARHKELMYQLAPRLKQICGRIQNELDRLKKAAGHLSGDELPRLASEVQEEAIPEWLDWIEKALGRFRDLIPTSDREQAFPMTARSQVTQLAPKRLNAPLVPLIRAQELPSAISMVSDDIPIQKRTNVTAAQKAEILDEEAEEEDFGDRPLTLKDIRQRAEQAAARRRKRTKPHSDTASTIHGNTGDSTMRGMLGGHTMGGEGRHRPSMAHEHPEEEQAALRSALDQRGAHGFHDEEDESHSHSGSEGDDHDGNRKRGGHSRKEALAAHLEDEGGAQPEITEEELGTAFLKRYKMSREELQVMADRMGIHLSNLCFLKQEFDHYDEDQSGYIDAGELKGLLKQLGEELNDEELDAAFKDLDSDGSGEIEFFEFVEWFTSAE